ncbi:hypothetical protein SAMN03084138_02522 [Enterovibrio norvegicus DSM 15893]|uniref:Uncharacterized protein n=1 Tax=Enterovibrio norvegicus DSM 15893 TaxID=1121869 RepID=A0A1I5RDT1_9GAMM|nr:hypothetical protein SAMN03084138_02522 [Enterovibrio norvegicus DSM 15893]
MYYSYMFKGKVVLISYCEVREKHKRKKAQAKSREGKETEKREAGCASFSLGLT